MNSPDGSPHQPQQEIIDILLSIREKITDDSDLDWTIYDTGEDLRHEIDKCIKDLEENDPEAWQNINFHFLPASTFQEHSLQNNWSEEYTKLAERFDKVYKMVNSH
ncbi:MAG: hypothetical protein ACOYXT_13665 [Bacteroidota bacterium]